MCVVCVLGGSVTVPVIDVCQVSVQPPARPVPVNSPAITRVVTAAAGEAELAATVKCTSASNLLQFNCKWCSRVVVVSPIIIIIIIIIIIFRVVGFPEI